MGKVTYGSTFQFPKEFGFTGSSKGPSNTHVQTPLKQNEFNDGLAKGGAVCKAKGGPVKKAFGGPMANPLAQRAIHTHAGQRMGAMRLPVPMAPRGANPAAGPRGALSSMIGAALGNASRFARPMKKGGHVKAAKGGAIPAMAPPSPPKLNRRGKLEIDPRMAMSIVKHATRVGALAGAQHATAAGGAPPMGAPPPMAAPPPGLGAPGAGMKKGGFIKGAIKHPGRMKEMAKRKGISVHAAMVQASHSKDPSLRSAGALGLRLTGGDLHKGKKKG